MTYKKSVILLDQARAYISLAKSLSNVNKLGAMHYLNQAKECIALINKESRMAKISELEELRTFLKVG